MEDWKLLEEYAAGSEDAFAELVKRHVGLVHAAARRQVTDPGLADDIAQAVFLLLARKAGSLPRQVILPGWLFNTTRLVALRAIRTETRRQHREQEALAMQPTQPEDETWNHLAPGLDEALARLPEADREALLLRFTEGRNHREVGTALGIGEDAAKKRVHRALDRLRSTLAMQGVGISLVVLTTLLDQNLSAATPPSLTARIVEGAVSGPGATNAAAVRLADAVSNAARRTRWLTATAVALGLVALVTTLLQTLRPTRTPSADPSATANVLTPATPTGQVIAAEAGADFPTTGVPFVIRVVSATTEQPITNARVLAHYVVGRQWIPRHGFRTDARGLCEIPIPTGDLMRLDVGVDAAGFENRYFTWHANWDRERPANHHFRLRPGIGIGGIVRNEAGQPVAGAEVLVEYNVSDAAWREPEEDIERAGWLRSIPAGVTGPDGRWEFTSVSPDTRYFTVKFQHPDHADFWLSMNRESARDVELWTQLRRREATVTLARGYPLSGVLVDPEGRPVVGAEVSYQSYTTNAVSQADGSFVIRPVPAGETRLLARAAGFAPKMFRLVPGAPPTRISLERGGQIRVRILDAQDEPIRGASLHLEASGTDPDYLWSQSTDQDGRVTFDCAPPSGTRIFTAGAPGFVMTRGFQLQIQSGEQIIRLLPQMRVRGSVVDADTGEPIPGFKVIPGYFQDPSDALLYEAVLDRSEARRGSAGQYSIPVANPNTAAIRIEALGYEPATDAPHPDSDRLPRCDFRLRRDLLANRVRGVVLRPDGSPAAQVDVALCTLEQGASIGLAKLVERDPRTTLRTDAKGEFAFPTLPTAHTLIAISPDGFRQVQVRGGTNLTLQLQPFGSVSGRYTRGGVPQEGKSIRMLPSAMGDYPGYLSSSGDYTTTTAADGSFVLNQVPPGEWNLCAIEGTHPFGQKCITVRPGESLVIPLGEPEPGSVTVVGRLTCAEPDLIEFWAPLINHANLQPALAPVSPPADLSPTARRFWLVDWHHSAAGRARECALAQYTPVVSNDGTFTIEGVRPGRYRLTFLLLAGSGTLRNLQDTEGRPWTANLLTEIEVPDATDGSGRFDAGTFPIQVKRPEAKPVQANGGE